VILGIDPSLNNVGYCFYPNGAEPGLSLSTVSIHPKLKKSQFEKMVAQTETLKKVIFSNIDKIQYVGIEQPYVASFGARGASGHQSANMWAVYSLMLYIIREAGLPVVMFNITQLHSLILRKKGITKLDIIAKAVEDIKQKPVSPHMSQCLERGLDEHQADAYFVAKHAHSFWQLIEKGRPAMEELTDDQVDIFTTCRTGKKGDRAGIIWRETDFWFDFRPSYSRQRYNELCQSLMP
jgi:Holliday junction resolvasome RuvABC endonuclease subunit